MQIQSYFVLLIISAVQLPRISGCPIYLTISLAGKTLYDSSLEINWGPDCHSIPEWIGLFTEDPSISNAHPERRIVVANKPFGKIDTNIKIGKIIFPKGWNRNDINYTPVEYVKGKCLPYYAASFNGNELLTIECLKIRPNWMAKTQYISEMQLKDIFIPGTHASGAYISKNGQTKSILMKEYVVAQHFDIWSQLVFGVRYLDLSIGYNSVNRYDTNNADNFWIVNENIYANPLLALLRDVKEFVRRSHEVVILDFSSFPIGFYKHPERHSGLMHLLREEIGELMYERNDTAISCYDLTVNDIRKANKYLMVLYPVEELPYPESESKIICPSWKRFSTGFMNNSETLDFMRLLFSKKDNSPVKDEGFVFHGVKSLEQSLNNEKLQTSKERAAHINPRVVNWLRGPWGLTANVIAMDYLDNTNLVDVAMHANEQKAFNMANKNLVHFEITSY